MIDMCRRTDMANNNRMTSSHDRMNMTRPGFYATKPAYRHPRRPSNASNGWAEFDQSGSNAVGLVGLSPEINGDAEDQNVSISAPNFNRRARSEGQLMGLASYNFSLNPSDRAIMRDMTPNTVLYSYVPVCKEDMNTVERQIPDWESTCEESPQTFLGVIDCPSIGSTERESGRDPLESPNDDVDVDSTTNSVEAN